MTLSMTQIKPSFTALRASSGEMAQPAVLRSLA
jgi:hypothetical protein